LRLAQAESLEDRRRLEPSPRGGAEEAVDARGSIAGKLHQEDEAGPG